MTVNNTLNPTISIWGPVGSGKTVYLATLAWMLKKLKNENWRIWPINEQSERFIIDNVVRMADGSFPLPTIQPQTLEFRLFRKNSLLGDYHINLWDTSGEMLGSGHRYYSSLGYEILDQSIGIIILIDPTINYRDDDYTRDLIASLQDYFQYLAQTKLNDEGYLSNVTISICLSKMDQYQYWKRRKKPKKFLEEIFPALEIITSLCDPSRLKFFPLHLLGFIKVGNIEIYQI